MDDLTAITRIKQGDWTGLESLVERYQARAMQAAYLIVGDLAQAEDIAQAAFIKAGQRIEQFDITRPFAPWFYRIVVNDALKAARREVRSLPLEPDWEDTPAAEIARWLTSPELPPELQMEQEELRRSVIQAVHSLPPQQRAVITMRYYLNLSETEMTERMERPLSSVKWWLRDARRRLRSLLNDYGREE